MKTFISRLYCLAVPVCLLAASAMAQSSIPSARKLLVPEQVWQVPDHNNYDSDTSLYSYHRKLESPAFAAFWAKDFGDTPEKYFDMPGILKECERFYQYYVDTLQFVEKGRSVSDAYKTLVYVTNSKDATAYGGGAGDKVGVLWVTPGRINKQPFGAMAHELGHVFQYYVKLDGHWGYSSSPKGSRGQAIFEMTSQYMLWQVYPLWMTFENYHLQSFMKQTHYAFLHEKNQYCSPYVLEYWSGKHGKDFIGRMWRNATPGEDPVTTYKRLNKIDQSTLNDELFDACRRFVTWDIDRIRDVAAPYANQHISPSTTVTDGWHRISAANCPQNYGYNAIRLNVPASGTKVKLQFKGLTGVAGYRNLQPDKAGWRYGFVAMLTDGKRVYGNVNRSTIGSAQFTVPANTEHLWLVVSGAPTGHWEHITDGKDETDEQWPYEFKLDGATVATK
ncbi:DUF6055 domain-containing protein [Chitinophaga horti]|uniref:DUF6055 domain-containing protein n=1 Tax=Chitinophaga horti TaxID=2920382 RepID=A0ABY6J714_9BACT|nr:DUF6055 domain-containing protein [Chitinophaga horti]UYQ95478.1 DUF6055 domain-containing protein [Chitinophaga horti]